MAALGNGGSLVEHLLRIDFEQRGHGLQVALAVLVQPGAKLVHTRLQSHGGEHVLQGLALGDVHDGAVARHHLDAKTG